MSFFFLVHALPGVLSRFLPGRKLFSPHLGGFPLSFLFFSFPSPVQGCRGIPLPLGKPAFLPPFFSDGAESFFFSFFLGKTYTYWARVELPPPPPHGATGQGGASFFSLAQGPSLPCCGTCFFLRHVQTTEHFFFFHRLDQGIGTFRPPCKVLGWYLLFPRQ